MIVHSDFHSTLLWHLSRSTDLSYLAQQVMALAPLSPEAWVCAGNVFSLLDDHSNGLKCFKRAIQIVESDEGHVSRKASGILSGVNAGEYPYVMAGHECVALEEWENALGFFREAIRRRAGCYTAWCVSALFPVSQGQRIAQVWLGQRLYEDWQASIGRVSFQQGRQHQSKQCHAGFMRGSGA
jgi:tetratricopeptide (TPR) repeat protein